MSCILIAAALSCVGAPAKAEGPAPTIRVAQPTVRLIDGVTVDVDASALLDSSNLRLAVMAADASDTIADPKEFMRLSVSIHAARVRLTLPGGPAGNDEVRLYHVPRFGTSFVVAARAPLTVAAGVEEAVLVRDLGREAAILGPVKFEAKYRNNEVLLQAQFLRVRPETEWDYRWFNGAIVGAAARPVGIISLGTRGVASQSSGIANEVLCFMTIEAEPQLQRVAALNPGDAVLMRGEPTAWSAASVSDPLILRNCAFAN